MFVFLLSSSARVYAHPSDSGPTPSAHALYKDAIIDFDAGRYQDACPKFEQVTRLVPNASGGKFMLASCYEKLGKLASAWAQYQLVATTPWRGLRPKQFSDAARKAASLQSMLAMLTIHVPEAVAAIPGVSVLRDGAPMERAQWGKAQPVDIGAHEIVATAPGRRPWQHRVQVSADGQLLSLTIGPLDAEPEPPRARPATLPLPSSARLLSQNEAGARTPSKRSWQRGVGYAASGLGIVGTGVGAALGFLALAKKEESKQHCDRFDRCDPTGAALRGTAVALGHASTASMLTGAISIAAGVILIITRPSGVSKPRGSRAASSIQLTTGPYDVQLQGAW